MRQAALAFIACLLTVVPIVAYGQDDLPTEENVSKFMRAKLLHSQHVLEGLTTEDFELVGKNAQKLSLLSLASTWQVLQTPEYVRQSTEFRRAVETLTKASDRKNLDGATLSFVNVTMKCVECHKYVRSVRNASLELDGWDDLKGGSAGNRTADAKWSWPNPTWAIRRVARIDSK